MTALTGLSPLQDHGESAGKPLGHGDAAWSQCGYTTVDSPERGLVVQLNDGSGTPPVAGLQVVTRGEEVDYTAPPDATSGVGICGLIVPATDDSGWNGYLNVDVHTTDTAGCSSIAHHTLDVVAGS